MAQIDEKDDCPSKKSWGEIWNGFFKKIVWKSADGFGEETGRSLGKILFWSIIILIGVSLLGTGVGYATNWFSGWFTGWFDWLPEWSWFDGDAAPEPAPEPAPKEADAPDCTHWRHTWAPAWLTPCR